MDERKLKIKDFKDIITPYKIIEVLAIGGRIYYYGSYEKLPEIILDLEIKELNATPYKARKKSFLKWGSRIEFWVEKNEDLEEIIKECLEEEDDGEGII